MGEEIPEIIDQIKQTKDFFQKARLIEYLQKEKKVTTKKVSDLLEMKPSYVCHITRLNRLPEIVVDGYYAELISVSHLFIIARLKEVNQMIMVYEKALANNLTVLQTEELVREYLYHIKAEGDHLGKNELHIAKALIEENHRNISVKIIQTRIKAKIVLEVKGNLKKTSQILKSILESLSK